MRLLTTLILLLLNLTISLSSATAFGDTEYDPDSIDPEMVNVMYLISPNALKTSSYAGGFPSAFSTKLCDNCQRKTYQLKKDAELLINSQPLALKDLTIALIKKKFDVIQLGIDRSAQTISYLYLGGISELSAEELTQEQPNEY